MESSSSMKTMAGAAFFGEQVAHPAGSHPDDHLDKLGGRHGEEGHSGLSGDGARQQRLAGPRGAAKEHPARDLGAQPGVPPRRAQEVDDLHQLLLRLVDAGHVLEGRSVTRWLVELGLAPADAAYPAQVSGATEDAPEDPHQQDRGTEPEKELLPPRRSLVGWVGIDHHLCGDQPQQQVILGIGGAFGLHQGRS